MVNLDACPFCGTSPQYSRIPGQGFSVLCPGCGAIAVYGPSSTQDALGAHWNARKVRHNLSVQSSLEACPFCASRQVEEHKLASGVALQCGNCSMMVSFVNGDTLDTAAALWNRRGGS